MLNPLSRYIIDDSIRDGEVAKSAFSSSSLLGSKPTDLSLAVTFDGKANRLVVMPNHESTQMDLDDSEDEMDVEIEELD